MRTLAVVILVLLLVTTVQAREVGKPIWGVKGGGLWTTMYGDDSSIMKTRMGGLIGVSVEYPLTSFLAIQGELVYSMRGWKNDKDLRVGGSAVEVNAKIGYLEIPALLRINNSGGAAGPYLLFGPALAVKTNDSFEKSVASYTLDAESFEVNSTEFLFMLGAGVEWPGAKYTMFIEARGSGGLTNTYKEVDMGNGATFQPDVKSETASVSVGVCF